MIFGLFPEQVDPDFIDRFFLPFLFLSFLFFAEESRSERKGGTNERLSVEETPLWIVHSTAPRGEQPIFRTERYAIVSCCSSSNHLSIGTPLLGGFYLLFSRSCLPHFRARKRDKERVYIYIFRRSLNIRTCTRFTIREHLLESSITI